MNAVAEVVSPKGDRMAAITSATVTARYEPATGTTFVRVEACGDEGHGGLRLVEVKASPGCYRDGQVLCLEIAFEPFAGDALRWSGEETFKRAAEYVVLLYQHAAQLRVVTARPVEKV